MWCKCPQESLGAVTSQQAVPLSPFCEVEERVKNPVSGKRGASVATCNLLFICPAQAVKVHRPSIKRGMYEADGARLTGALLCSGNGS